MLSRVSFQVSLSLIFPAPDICPFKLGLLRVPLCNVCIMVSWGFVWQSDQLAPSPSVEQGYFSINQTQKNSIMPPTSMQKSHSSGSGMFELSTRLAADAALIEKRQAVEPMAWDSAEAVPFSPRSLCPQEWAELTDHVVRTMFSQHVSIKWPSHTFCTTWSVVPPLITVNLFELVRVQPGLTSGAGIIIVEYKRRQRESSVWRWNQIVALSDLDAGKRINLNLPLYTSELLIQN